MSMDDLLRELHEESIRLLLKRIRSGEDVKAADLEVARKFLADNGVNADIDRNPGLQKLKSSVLDKLPFTDERAN
jgi:hypothetical protein